MAPVETQRVSTSGQMSLPAAVRHRWNLDEGGQVEVFDLGFGVLTVPSGYSDGMLDEILPAEYAVATGEEDPDLVSR
jgi:AbrB family looped-hinge helix DNA binding protein